MPMKAKTETAKKRDPGTGASVTTPEELHYAIQLTAYYFAERRNFEPGHELEDWLSAEAQVLAEAQAYRGMPA